MQVYRGVDVMTATPSSDELDILPHSGINDLSPADDYSVKDFLSRAQRAGKRAREAGHLLTVVGGTPLYLKAFLFGLDELPPPDEDFRQQLREQAEREGRAAVHDRLKDVDPTAAGNIHPNDLKRTIRALEIHHQTGRTKTEITSGTEEVRPEIDPEVVGLRRPDEELRARIRDRCDRMIQHGLIEEVRELLDGEVARTLRQAIGFQEVEAFLEDDLTREELAEEMSTNTWQYVRKQRTWYRQFPVREWYHPEADRKEIVNHVEQLAQRTTR